MKLARILAALMLLSLLITGCSGKNGDHELRNAMDTYNKYIAEHPETAEAFLYVAKGGFVAVKGEATSPIFATKREALRWLYDDTTTAVDESLAYGAVETENEKMLACKRGSAYAGKLVSVVGDSISTFDGVSNNTDINATLGDHFLYYTPTRPEVPVLSREDTWWQQVIDAMGMELCVNNSSSGTRIRTDINGAVNAAYKERCVQLHTNDGREPDVILVFMGTNDFTRDMVNVGRLENLDYASVETRVDVGKENPETVCEAYATMLYKMQKRYPQAEIYCMLIMPRRVNPVPGREDYSMYGQPTFFNEMLRSIAERYGCKVVDLEHCGIPLDGPEFDYFIQDQGLHPGKYGMDAISNAVISVMRGEEIIPIKIPE